MAGNMGTPGGGRKGIPLEDAKRMRAQQIGGQPMTDVGRARVEMMGKARDFQERAAALGLTPHQYMLQMDSGKLPPTDLPAEFRKFLTENPDARLVDPGAPVQAAAPAATAPSPSTIPVAEAQADLSQVARFTPDELASLGLIGDPSAVPMIGSPDGGYGNAAEAIKMRQLAAGRQVGGPSGVPLPSGAPPRQVLPNGAFVDLRSPIWGTGKTLLLFEQLVACLAELGMTDKMSEFQRAVDRNGLSYLEEVLARMQWRVTYVKNRQRFGRGDADISAGLNAYERLLRPITEFIHGGMPGERDLFLSEEQIDAGSGGAEEER